MKENNSSTQLRPRGVAEADDDVLPLPSHLNMVSNVNLLPPTTTDYAFWINTPTRTHLHSDTPSPAAWMVLQIAQPRVSRRRHTLVIVCCCCLSFYVFIPPPPNRQLPQSTIRTEATSSDGQSF